MRSQRKVPVYASYDDVGDASKILGHVTGNRKLDQVHADGIYHNAPNYHLGLYIKNGLCVLIYSCDLLRCANARLMQPYGISVTPEEAAYMVISTGHMDDMQHPNSPLYHLRLQPITRCDVRYTDSVFLDVVGTGSKSTAEVSQIIGCTRTTAVLRLSDLCDRGLVTKKSYNYPNNVIGFYWAMTDQETAVEQVV